MKKDSLKIKNINIFPVNTFQTNSTPMNISSKKNKKLEKSKFNLGLSCDSNINYFSHYNFNAKYNGKNSMRNDISINSLTQSNISNFLKNTDHTPDKNYLKKEKKHSFNLNLKKNNKNNSVLINYLKKKNNKTLLNKIGKDDEIEMFFKNYKINNSEFLKFKHFRDKKKTYKNYNSLSKANTKEKEYNYHQKCHSQRNDFDNNIFINKSSSIKAVKIETLSKNKSYNDKIYMNKIRYYYNINQNYNKYQKNRINKNKI